MMNNERVEKILDCYGGSPEQWPETEREAMLQAITADSGLQALQRQALQLDEQLAGLFAEVDDSASEDLAQRILNLLPERQQVGRPNDFHSLLAWVRRSVSSILEPKYALPLAGASLALVVAMVLLPVQQQTEQAGILIVSVDDAWSMMAESLESPSDELALLAALEPELYEDGWDSL